MFPLMMTDEHGVDKFIFTEQRAQELNQRVVSAQKKKLEEQPATKQQSATTESIGIHGLAPTGMQIPSKGNSFRVGGRRSAKEPLRESNHEKYNRIKAEQEEKRIKKDKRTVKKLKKEGKLCTLAPFMYL
jgi:hypothetical protein